MEKGGTEGAEKRKEPREKVGAAGDKIEGNMAKEAGSVVDL